VGESYTPLIAAPPATRPLGVRAGWARPISEGVGVLGRFSFYLVFIFSSVFYVSIFYIYLYHIFYIFKIQELF
jgi:hypothetical protein